MKTKNQIDMTTGGIVQKLLIFSIPIIFSGILQLVFNAADIIVVGQFAGDESATKVSSLRSSGSENYVPNSATYHAELIKTSSGDAVLGILFKRK